MARVRQCEMRNAQQWKEDCSRQTEPDTGRGTRKRTSDLAPASRTRCHINTVTASGPTLRTGLPWFAASQKASQHIPNTPLRRRSTCGGLGAVLALAGHDGCLAILLILRWMTSLVIHPARVCITHAQVCAICLSFSSRASHISIIDVLHRVPNLLQNARTHELPYGIGGLARDRTERLAPHHPHALYNCRARLRLMRRPAATRLQRPPRQTVRDITA